MRSAAVKTRGCLETVSCRELASHACERHNWSVRNNACYAAQTCAYHYTEVAEEGAGACGLVYGDCRVSSGLHAISKPVMYHGLSLHCYRGARAEVNAKLKVSRAVATYWTSVRTYSVDCIALQIAGVHEATAACLRVVKSDKSVVQAVKCICELAGEFC